MASRHRMLTIVFVALSGALKLASADMSASKLASEIVTAACDLNSTEQIRFYRSVRSSYSSIQDFQHPMKAGSQSDHLDFVAKPILMSLRKENYSLALNYQTFFQDIIGPTFASPNNTLHTEYFEWCLHLISPDDTPIYGCIKGNNRSSTEQFSQLGLSDVIFYNENSFAFAGATIFVSLTGDFTNVLEDALLVCTVKVPWLSHSIGVFHRLAVIGTQFVQLTKFPSQDDGFLVKDEYKAFSADIFTVHDLGGFVWYKDGLDVRRVVDVHDTTCIRIDGNFRQPNCSNENVSIGYSVLDIRETTFSSCEVANEFRTRKQRILLGIYSPSVADTGEYQLRKVDTHNNSTVTLSTTLFIAVIFTEFPSKVSLPLGNSSSTLSCVLKAPVNSTVYWQFEGQPVNNATFNCSETSLRTESLDDKRFWMFYNDLKLCNITEENVGKYSCLVEYTTSLSPKVYVARQDVSVLTVDPPENVRDIDPLSIGAVVGATVSVVVVLSVVSIVIVTVVILVVRIKRTEHRRTLKKRPSKHLLLRPHLVKGDAAYIDLCSPDIIKKSGELDFPRQNLELVVELGQGKFGRVFKAKAYGMVSSLPHINTVAVKTTLTSGSFGETHRLLNELQLLKKLYKQPHKNICNLLGHCIKMEPKYLILEFACHGNLKKNLLLCREALLSQGCELTIDTSTQSQDVSKFNPQLHIVASGTNPLQVHPGSLPVESSDVEKNLPQADSPFTHPGLIKETQLCDFAQQIASGLKHLMDMNIVHCDLAARNILVAEKGVLKIGDFGMAREVNEAEPPYQNLCIQNEDHIIPAKWAAPELLVGHSHSFKSDIWSFGVTLWEIASYGSEPYSDFKVGATLEPLLKHLQEGNRLTQPAGLNSYLYRQMCGCWSLDPSSRPCAEELVEFFRTVDPNTIALRDMLEGVSV